MEFFSSEVMAFLFTGIALTAGIGISIGAWRIVRKYGGDKDPSRADE
ncbi:MAG: hypothetical protein J4F97_01600 [Pseudomonadales bacterium]|nr:hypothetical protein [Pseudomonadales bacterium]